MSLKVKSLSSLNLEGTPLYNNIFPNIQEWKSVLETEDCGELNIICIQGVYGYRTGFIGKLFNMFGYQLSKCSNPIYLQSILKIFYDVNANDYEIIAFLLSMISRIIPINNMCVFDTKEYLNTLQHINRNDSHTSIFNLKSLFLLQPLFDSGCAIYSNRECTQSGFEKWNDVEIVYNKGMTWCYFESDTNDTGITIINLDFNKDNTDEEDVIHLIQLVELKTSLEQKYGNTLHRYETYILGDFNIIFGLRTVIRELNEKWVLLENANIKIINENNHTVATQFVMYSKLTNNITETVHVDYSDHLPDSEKIIYKFSTRKAIDNNYTNPIFKNIKIATTEEVIKHETTVEIVVSDIELDKPKEITYSDMDFEKSSVIVDYNKLCYDECIAQINKLYSNKEVGIKNYIVESYFDNKSESSEEWEFLQLPEKYDK
jgi:hypothetical protein